jgi:isopenicillin-N epimerase
MERQPVRFFVREYQRQLDQARAELADFLGADPAGLVFVTNATTGVNAVLRSLELSPGDELLTTNHVYGACRSTLHYVAGRQRARVVEAEVPFPIHGPQQVVDAVMSRVSRNTRLALLDHVTSPTGLRFPVEELVEALAACDVDVLVDGAHAPGMLPLDLEAVGAAYYTGNCHKWLCAPKGVGFLYLRQDRRECVHPTTTSHGYDFPVHDRSRLHLEFDWPGTFDPSALLALPEALRFMGSLISGGWQALMRRNRQLALEARRILCDALAVSPPCPESMVGALAALELPDGPPNTATSALYTDPLQDLLLERHGIEVPIIPWPAPPSRLLRVSAQLYNAPQEYQHLGRVLAPLLRG